ncbi:MAG: transcription antitermination factor NusB [Kiritimatiellia bacterium]
MATRRQGREWALQMLFQADMNPGLDLDMSIPKFWRQQYTCKVEEAERRDEELPESNKPVEDRVAPPKIREFTEKLVRGVRGHLEEIDAKLVAYTQNWPLHRMGSVERNVLRLAFYELLYCSDVPPAVVLNEAIDLAKYFSNTDSGRFVNGILDRLNKELHGKTVASGTRPGVQAT